MEIINGKKYYDIDEASKMLDKVILEQSELLRKNLKEKRTKNTFVREVAYV